MDRREKLLVYFCLLISLICAVFCLQHVEAATFNITLTTPFTETEENFAALLVANVTDEFGICHEDNMTFTVTGVPFVYSDYTGLYYGTVTHTTPMTVTYGVLGAFVDSENMTSTGQIIQNVTVTWTTGTLERLQVKFVQGNWLGAIFDEEAYVIGGMTLYTVILGIFSIGIWNVTGVYGTFMAWLLGWGIFASQVNGQGQVLALLLFALGCGIMVAKLYLDRRTT